MEFKIGDKVNTPSGVGEVWKVKHDSVHVKHWHGKKNCPHDWIYSKYLSTPYHHSQQGIDKISKI